MKCIFCDKEATHVIRPDIDVTGLGACVDHTRDLQLGMIIHKEWDDFDRYIKSIQRRDKQKAQK